MKIELTPKGKAFQIAYNNSNKKLADRSEAELAQLLIMAHRSGRQDYLDMFKDPPSLEDLLEAQTDGKLAGLIEPKAPALASHPGQLPADVPAMPFITNPSQVNTGETSDSGDTAAVATTTAPVSTSTGGTGSTGTTGGAGTSGTGNSTKA